MTVEAFEALHTRISDDPDADLGSLRRSTDTVLAIGQDVWRLRWRNQLTTAVAADANLATTCGAVLDVLALLETQLDLLKAAPGGPTLDLGVVNVLVDRPFPDISPSETDQAMRSMRAAVVGVTARIWYRRDPVGWQEDDSPPPSWAADDPALTQCVHGLLLPRLIAQPTGLTAELVAAVDDASLHLYPSEIKATVPDRWALRIDGLQIGISSAASATLSIGQPGKSGDGPQRKAFTSVFGQTAVTVSSAAHTSVSELSVSQAAERIRTLLRTFRAADVPGAPLTHRQVGGMPIVDEHALEARLLKGLVQINADTGLVLDDKAVARGSQFPTLWGQGTQWRYLDALVRRGAIPIAVELKVATGGQGRYYRRSLVQAVLYRHFIKHAPAVDPWFTAGDLDRSAIEGAIGIPIPRAWTPTFHASLELLERVAARVGISVHVLDDRLTPDWVAEPGLPEPNEKQCEALSWRLAAHLSRQHPVALGRIVEIHAMGFYDQIQLQSLSDRTLALPSPLPRISLNRPGSAWVFSQTGAPRWTWREIWNHLAAGHDPADAATTIGTIAGLGPPHPAPTPCFAEMAAAFLEIAGPEWSWRCAWPCHEDPSHWVNRFAKPLRRYRRTAPGDEIPTIGRIWGAIHNSEAVLIVDQQNLRTWMWINDGSQELANDHPIDRVVEAASRLLGVDPIPSGPH